MSPPSRRSIIAAGATIASAGLAGCLSAPENRRTSPGCDGMHDAVVEIELSALSAARREEVDLIQYFDLSDGEQRIVRTAMEDGQYRKCPGPDGAFPEPLQVFRDRVSNHITENYHAYLTQSGTIYAIGLEIRDVEVASLP